MQWRANSCTGILAWAAACALTARRARRVDFACGALFLVVDRGRLLTVPLIHSLDELAAARATPPPEHVPDALPFVSARAVEASPRTNNLTLILEEEGERDGLPPPLFLSDGDTEDLYLMSD